MNSNLQIFRSRILYGGNPLTRDTIVIGNVYVSLVKRGLITKTNNTVSIPIRNITEVEICNSFPGKSIHIESLADRSITGHGFSGRTAGEIYKALSSVIDQLKQQESY